MRRFAMAVLTAAVLLLSSRATVAAENSGTSVREIDVQRSKVSFTVEHIFVEHVTGTVVVTRGTVALPPGSSVPIAINAELDATTLRTGDDDRDGVLQTGDWFDTKRFAHWIFVSTNISANTAKNGANTFGVDGTLTMHGVTAPEHLDVTIGGTAADPIYHAVGRVDRHAFGMKRVPLDPAIGRDVDIVLEIRLKPSA
jgi:polyisoprenoid-binding protein YceI